MTTARTSRIAAGAIALALLLAACGSSDSSDGAKATTTATAATAADDGATTTTAGSDTGSSSGVAKAKDAGDLGSVLADAEGNTLYTLTSGDKPVPCTGGCLDAWPPAIVAAGTSGTVGGVALGTADGPDGKPLLTADGLPLYRFAGDEGPSDANGDGITSFGGTWHVVKVEASSSDDDATDTTMGGSSSDDETTTTATSTGGGDY